MTARSRRLFLVLALCLSMTGSLAAQEAAPQAPPALPPADQPAGAPVVVGGKTLFHVRERVLSFSPEDRARAISERIVRLAKQPYLRIDSLAVVEAEGSSEIVLGDLVIMTVTERDARASGISRHALAQEYADSVRAAIAQLQEDYGTRSLLLGVLWSLLATVALLLLFKLMSVVFPRLCALLDSWRGTRIPSIRIQKLELLSSDRITNALIWIAKGARVAAVLVLFYFYLPLIFSFFPWTRGYAAVLFGYVLAPLRQVGAAIVSYLPDLFFVLVILVVARYTVKLVKLIFAEVGRGTLVFPGFHPEWADPTYKIARFLIIAFTVVVIFPYLPGSESPAFRGVSIFLGVLFSLGSTSAVANVVAGVILTYMRPYKVGDRVKIADTVGDVMEKDLLVTRIRTIKNVDVTIPNALVLGSHLINFSSSAQHTGLVLHTQVTIGYDAPWRKVHELLLAAAACTPGILKQPAPFVHQTGLDDFFVRYELNAYTQEPNRMASLYSQLHQNIQDKFNEAGVEIMSPHYSALRDGNTTAIPDQYLPREYSPPGFQLIQRNPAKKGSLAGKPASEEE